MVFVTGPDPGIDTEFEQAHLCIMRWIILEPLFSSSRRMHAVLPLEKLLNWHHKTCTILGYLLIHEKVSMKKA